LRQDFLFIGKNYFGNTQFDIVDGEVKYMTNCTAIMAVLQENRVETAPRVQEVLTEFGCHIRVRLGLHDAAVDQCANTGLILLQLCGPDAPVEAMEAKLRAIPRVKVKSMRLDF